MKEESMSQKMPSPQFANVIMLGAVWGFAEAGLGLGLQRCAALASGSIMTGVALLFIAAAWVLTRRAAGVLLMVGLVTIMKLFDAQLLSLPIRHGAVANPIFAFWVEALAFLVFVAIIKEKLALKRHGQAFLGAGAALLAVNLFPLVKFTTGIPACVVAGTGYPLSLYYAPIAVGLSLLTVPAGFWLGERVAAAEAAHEAFVRRKAFRYWVSPLAVAVSLLLMAALRLAG
jgi:hypothetical protein